MNDRLAAIAAQVKAPFVARRANSPLTAEQIREIKAAKAEREATAPKPERQRASAPDPVPADPYVWATVRTADGFYSAEMRQSAALALQASGASVRVRDERPRSAGLPAYEAPAQVCRSHNYNRATTWQKAQQTRVYLPR